MTCNDECIKPRGRQAHCSACHRTFSTVGGFDLHRKFDACRMDGLKQGLDGVWRILLNESGLARLARFRAER